MVGPVLQQLKEEHPGWTTISAYTLENKKYLISLWWMNENTIFQKQLKLVIVKGMVGPAVQQYL